MVEFDTQKALEYRIEDLMRGKEGFEQFERMDNMAFEEMSASQIAKWGAKRLELETQSPFSIPKLKQDAANKIYPISLYLINQEIINVLRKVGYGNHWKSKEFLGLMEKYKYAHADLNVTQSMTMGPGATFLPPKTLAFIIFNGDNVFETKERMVEEYKQRKDSLYLPIELVEGGLKGRVLTNYELYPKVNVVSFPEGGMSGLRR
jgi:hypothetical protein